MLYERRKVSLNTLLLNQLVILSSSASELEEKARILGFDQQMIIQTLLHMATALTLFLVLAKLLFKPVQKVLDDRKQNISNEYKKIQKDTEYAASLKTEYEAKLTNVKKEAEGILAEARRKAMVQEGKVLDEARQEAQTILSRAHLEIERERAQVAEDIRKEIIEVATLMASKFVAAAMDDKTKDQIFENALSEMGENTWLN